MSNLLPGAANDREQRLTGSNVDALLDRMFAPPFVDAGQVPMNAHSRPQSGEMRLALAVLEDALRRALRHLDSRLVEQRMAAHEALEWMRSDDDSPPFTFVRICQLFDLDPDWIRDSVHRHLGRARQDATPDDRTRRAA